jgi:hypothetical protein
VGDAAMQTCCYTAHTRHAAASTAADSKLISARNIYHTPLLFLLPLVPCSVCRCQSCLHTLSMCTTKTNAMTGAHTAGCCCEVAQLMSALTSTSSLSIHL